MRCNLQWQIKFYLSLSRTAREKNPIQVANLAAWGRQVRLPRHVCTNTRDNFELYPPLCERLAPLGTIESPHLNPSVPYCRDLRRFQGVGGGNDDTRQQFFEWLENGKITHRILEKCLRQGTGTDPRLPGIQFIHNKAALFWDGSQG